MEVKTKTISDIIRKTRPTKEVARIALELSYYLNTQNPDFDKDKFLGACGF